MNIEFSYKSYKDNELLHELDYECIAYENCCECDHDHKKTIEDIKKELSLRGVEHEY